MATDTWIGFDDKWDTKNDWSHGVPHAKSDVMINEFGPEVTKSFGTVASIEIGNNGSLSFIDAGKNSVAHRVLNSGKIDLDTSNGDGGSVLSIGGALDNGGILTIGPGGEGGTLSANSTVEAASVTNFIDGANGFITLDDGSSTAEATLDVSSAAGFGAAGTLYGHVALFGDALVEFARGQINTISTFGELILSGPDAFIADASNTSSNSALQGLKTVAGTLLIENGATVATSEALTNSGSLQLSIGAAMTVAGTLTNSGDINLSQDTEVGRDSLTVGGALINDGGLQIIEVGGDGTSQATLSVKGPFTNDGIVEFDDGVGKVAGAVSGTGSFDIAEGSALQLDRGVSSGQQVDFQAGAADTLTLESASSFHGTINDFFTGGDTVDATTFAKKSTKFVYTQTSTDICTWTLTDGAHTAVLTFAGDLYLRKDFSIVSANHGAGSAIEFV